MKRQCRIPPLVSRPSLILVLHGMLSFGVSAIGAEGAFNYQIDGHIFQDGDGRRLERSGFVQLMGGYDRDALVPIGKPLQFSGGRFFDGVVSIPWAQAGEAVWMQATVFIGPDFSRSECCGLTNLIRVGLKPRLEVDQRARLEFDRFQICSACTIDECFIPPPPSPKFSYMIQGDRLKITWSGGFLEAADQVDGPYERISRVTATEELLRTNQRTFRMNEARHFFRVALPCMPREFEDRRIDYFREADVNGFRNLWYSRALADLGEPSVRVPREGVLESYRLLWLASFGPTQVVRYDRLASGFVKKTAVLGWEGSDFSRCIIDSSFESLSEEEWATFKTDFDKVGYWDLAIHEEILGADGVQTVFEVRVADRYHIVNRWTPSHDTRARGLVDYWRFFERKFNQ